MHPSKRRDKHLQTTNKFSWSALIVLDLRKKATLTRSEALWICSVMQSIMLDEILAATRWSSDHAVFHGGTSINLAWQSPRFSEDLDFMVSADVLDQLEEAVGDVAGKIERRVRLLLPGSTLVLKSSRERPGRDRMDTWDLRWSHAMRQGVAKVKGEFYAVQPDLLHMYGSDTISSFPGSRAAVRMGSSIPVADLVSLWGDKIKAISSRPEFKMRDAHDLGFIARQFDVFGRPSSDDLLQAVTLSGRIYGREPRETLEGIQLRLDDGTMERQDDFMADMSRWFDDGLFENARTTGTLQDMWRRTREELEFGASLLASVVMAPALAA